MCFDNTHFLVIEEANVDGTNVQEEINFPISLLFKR